jgi:aminoglycoside phosphotransferase family enzyme/predicted kinase
MDDARYPELISALRNPAAYDHPVDTVEIRETHISWVLLTGPYAYKIKKPVDFGFLDFTTLDKRRRFCEEELRLNRRLAPNLYLAVVPIAGDPRNPRIGVSGAPIEFAIKMRRFDEAALFDRLCQDDRLSAEHMDKLAETLARFHACVNRSTAEDAHGLPEHIHDTAEQNFTHIEPLQDDPDDLAKLETVRAWTSEAYSRCREAMLARKAAGFVRECHGDLHLGNIVLIDDEPTPFDCIEFSEDLRWIDVMSELAFLVMDLEVKGKRNLAFRLLNRYLEVTGEYRGLSLFDYYRVYRAMVRSKIAQLTRASSRDTAKQQELLELYRRYLDYASGLIRPPKPALLITHGFSGSGKSYIAGQIAECLPAIRLRSDLERKRLAGFDAHANTGSTIDAGIYTADMTRRTYDYLLDTAEVILKSGLSVIVDATFLKHEQRESQRRLAERLAAPFLILDCQAPIATLKSRIESRALQGRDPSEADLSVLDHQLAAHDEFTEKEQRDTLMIETIEAVSVDELLKKIGLITNKSPG